MAAEISFKSSGVKTDDPGLLQKVENLPVGISTPVQLGVNRSGLFQMHFDPLTQIADNLKNLVLTNHGERLGNHFFGANLQPLATELSAGDDFDAQAMSRIQEAVRSSMPFVELETFSSGPGQVDRGGSSDGVAKIDLSIKFSVPSLGSTGNKITVSLYVIG